MLATLSTFLVTLGASVPIPIPDFTAADWGQTLLLLIVTGFSVLFTYLGVKRKARAEERVVSMEAQASTTQAGLELLIENLTSRLTKVEEELKELRGVNRNLELANHQLSAMLKTKDDVIEAFASVLVAWEDWFRSGSPDPPGPPGYTWQVRLHMKELSESVQKTADASQRLQQELDDS